MFIISKYNSLIIVLIESSQQRYKTYEYDGQNLNTELTDRWILE